MAPQQQVYIVFNAPPPSPAYEVKISIPEATTDKPKVQDPMIDMGETRITFGKHKDKRSRSFRAVSIMAVGYCPQNDEGECASGNIDH